jgi:hypothetical protein
MKAIIDPIEDPCDRCKMKENARPKIRTRNVGYDAPEAPYPQSYRRQNYEACSPKEWESARILNNREYEDRTDERRQPTALVIKNKTNRRDDQNDNRAKAASAE